MTTAGGLRLMQRELSVLLLAVRVYNDDTSNALRHLLYRIHGVRNVILNGATLHYI